MVHVAILKATKMTAYIFRANQVPSAQLTALKRDMAPTKISPEFQDYFYVFSPEMAIEFCENTGINENAINLIKDKQPLYEPISVILEA